jgi:hypothetical protein
MELSSPQPNGQSLFLYLLTCPERTPLPGLFRAYEAGLAQALGWSLDGFRRAWAEVSEAQMVKADWKAGLVWIPKAIVHERPESPNHIAGWKSAWDELPECDLKAEAFESMRPFIEALGETFAEAFVDACPKPLRSMKMKMKQEMKQEQDQETQIPIDPPAGQGSLPGVASDAGGSGEPPSVDPVMIVFVHWQEKQSALTKARLTSLKPTKDRKRRVTARLREGYTVEDLKLAVDGMFATDWNIEKGFTDLELACRDAAHVDRFVAAAGVASPDEPEDFFVAPGVAPGAPAPASAEAHEALEDLFAARAEVRP